MGTGQGGSVYRRAVHMPGWLSVSSTRISIQKGRKRIDHVPFAMQWVPPHIPNLQVLCIGSLLPQTHTTQAPPRTSSSHGINSPIVVSTQETCKVPSLQTLPPYTHITCIFRNCFALRVSQPLICSSPGEYKLKPQNGIWRHVSSLSSPAL